MQFNRFCKFPTDISAYGCYLILRLGLGLCTRHDQGLFLTCRCTLQPRRTNVGNNEVLEQLWKENPFQGFRAFQKDTIIQFRPS